MVKIYAAEVAHTPLKVNIIDPGRTRTKMRAQAFPGEDPKTLRTPEEITDVFVQAARADYSETGQLLLAQPDLK